MAIAEDGSTPAVATSTTGTATSASFTAPEGSLVVALVALTNVGPVATLAGTVTDSVGGSWRLLHRATSSSGSTVEAWALDASSAVARTVTAASSSVGITLAVRVITGAQPAAAQPGTMYSSAFVAYNRSVTAVVTGSLLYGLFSASGEQVTLTANGSTTNISSTADATNNGTRAVCKLTAATTGGSAVTLGYTQGSIGTRGLCLEIIPTGTSKLFGGTLEVELTAGSWTDISAYINFRRSVVKVTQGARSAGDDVSPAQLTVNLDNRDGRFMPGLPASALYPNWSIGKRIRWKVTRDGGVWTRFVGKIQAITPDFPAADVGSADVTVTATDSLGVLAQRKLRSNFTEVMLWRARLDSCNVDAYEATGKVSGLAALMTNYSTDAGKGDPTAATSAAYPLLSFGEDDLTSIGGVVSWSTTGTMNSTLCGFRSGLLQIAVHLKCQTDVPALGAILTIATFHTNALGGAPAWHLTLEENVGNIGLWVRDSTYASRWGLIGNVPSEGWVQVILKSNSGTPANCDFSVTWADGSAGGGGFTRAGADVRNIRAVEFPGAGTLTYANPSSAGGIAALGTRSVWDWQEWVVSAAGRTTSTRMGHFSNTVAPLGVTTTNLGNLSGDVATGDWADRPALEVLQELLRTWSGIAWARNRDDVVCAVDSSNLWPSSSLPPATIDLERDCEGPPSLVLGSETLPTRVDATWPGGRETVANTALETSLGLVRTKSITTVASDRGQAVAAAQSVLNRTVTGLRYSQITVDLVAPVNAGITYRLLDEQTTLGLGGLYPTQRIRVSGQPATHFPAPTDDVHVSGWVEEWGADFARIKLDTLPALTSTLASETFTGANGAGLSAVTFDGIVVTGSGGSAVIQSNRGRFTSGVGAGFGQFARFTVRDRDVEITGTFRLGDTTAQAVVATRSTDLGVNSNGYRLLLSSSGTLRLQRNGTDVATWSAALSALTDYGFRLRAVGAYVNARVWARAGTEPGTWDAAYVDPAPLSWGRSHIGGASPDAVARFAEFDDVVVTDGA